MVLLLTMSNHTSIYTHLKIVFGNNPKTILLSKVLGAFQSWDNGNQDLVFYKAKNQTGFSILQNQIGIS
jgi:hypothetical protein